MKKFGDFFQEATEAQVRAQNPNASPEMVRRAAERSQRSKAQREAKYATNQDAQKKGQRSLPGKGEIVKRQPDKGGALVSTRKRTPTSGAKPEGGADDAKKYFRDKIRTNARRERTANDIADIKAERGQKLKKAVGKTLSALKPQKGRNPGSGGHGGGGDMGSTFKAAS